MVDYEGRLPEGGGMNWKITEGRVCQTESLPGIWFEVVFVSTEVSTHKLRAFDFLDKPEEDQYTVDDGKEMK